MAPTGIHRSVITGLLIDAGLPEIAGAADLDLVLTVRGEAVTQVEASSIVPEAPPVEEAEEPKKGRKGG